MLSELGRGLEGWKVVTCSKAKKKIQRLGYARLCVKFQNGKADESAKFANIHTSHGIYWNL